MCSYKVPCFLTVIVNLLNPIARRWFFINGYVIYINRREEFPAYYFGRGSKQITYQIIFVIKYYIYIKRYW